VANPVDDTTAVRRLVQRLGLGPAPGELTAARAVGFERTLDDLLAPAGADPGVTATPPPTLDPPPPLPPGAGKDQRAAANHATDLQIQALQLWWLDRMAVTTQPLRERATFFWHGHFATSVRKVQSPRLMLAQNETQRRLALGDFRDLARAMVVDPAMLVWLDGPQNRRGAPNENLARELMELFVLGVDNYSQNDVREAARALTGWRVDRPTGTATPVPARHDPGPETVLGSTASLDATGLVDLMVDRPGSATFLAGRACLRLLSSGTADPAAVERIAAAYRPGRDITAMIRALATDPVFRDPGSVLVRQPIEWLVGALRALRLRPSALPATTRGRLLAATRGLGQLVFEPPNVGGWPSGGVWLTTATALGRLTLANGLVAAADLSAVADQPLGARVDAVAELLGLGPLTDRTAAALRRVAGQPAQLVALALVTPENLVSA
jgi:uncharacterized protein (DUF1800 family)